MKNLNLFLFFSVFFLGILSCNNDAVDLVEIQTDQVEFTLSATYKGVQYEVPGKLDEHGNPVYLSKEFNDLYQNTLSKFPNLVTMVTDNNVVEYFESLKEVFSEEGLKILDQMNETNINDVTTRYFGGVGYVQVWDDSNYTDRSLPFPVGLLTFITITQLRDYENFNDKISSLKIWNYVNSPTDIITDPWGNSRFAANLRVTFVGYEHDNYKGNVLLCLGAPTYNSNPAHEDPKLGNIGWNDKITAIKVCLTAVTNSSGGLDVLSYQGNYPSTNPYAPH
jgi:hypothetical protein